MKYDANGSLITEEKENGENNMDNSSLNATEIAVGSLLAGNNRGGGGAWNNGQGDVWATQGSNAVRINRNAQQNENLSDSINSGIGALADDNKFQTTNQNITTGHARICDNLNNTALRGAVDGGNDKVILTRQLADIQRQIDACCCENQKGMLQMKSDLLLEMCKNTHLLEDKIRDNKDEIFVNRTEMLAIESRGTTAELAKAQARINQLEIIAALPSGHHGH